METHFNHTLFDRRQIIKPRNSAVKWSKQWVPQEVVATGGKRLVLKWVNEATLNAMKHKPYEPSVVGTEPEPTTEVLFLCSYEGCGKTFFDAGALKKHSHIHAERQYICHYENCGKKFLDSSKLKRHFLSHTGERHFVCPHEGCGKAFSLDFNLRSHMKTHSQENYHICPYPECGKRFAHGYKLRNHIGAHHDKNIITDAPKYHTPPPEKPVKVLKSSAGPSGPASSERPFSCPYEGCEKAYIHEYKLNLHLKREHPGHLHDEKAKKAEPFYEGTDLDAYGGKHKAQKQNKRKLNSNLKVPPSKAPQRKSGNNGSSAFDLNVVKKTWPPCKEDVYEDEDSEETEEERENVREGWANGQNNNDDDDDDEETEYED